MPEAKEKEVTTPTKNKPNPRDTIALRVLESAAPNRYLLFKALEKHSVSDELFTELIKVAKKELKKRA